MGVPYSNIDRGGVAQGPTQASAGNIDAMHNANEAWRQGRAMLLLGVISSLIIGFAAGYAVHDIVVEPLNR